MKSVTTETGGTAYATFKNFDVEIGGKTGSAEVGDKTNAWFVGFAPAEKPEIVVSVLAESVVGGGAVAAPIVKAVLEAYFDKKYPQKEENSENDNSKNNNDKNIKEIKANVTR